MIRHEELQKTDVGTGYQPPVRSQEVHPVFDVMWISKVEITVLTIGHYVQFGVNFMFTELSEKG